jgi:hypothetical protein
VEGIGEVMNGLTPFVFAEENKAPPVARRDFVRKLVLEICESPHCLVTASRSLSQCNAVGVI